MTYINVAPLQDVVDYAYWTDRHGINNTYFTGNKMMGFFLDKNLFSGSNFGYHVCDCHYEDEGCMEEVDKDTTCNCDANLPIPLHDTGVITNMTALPVTKLYFGGLFFSLKI